MSTSNPAIRAGFERVFVELPGKTVSYLKCRSAIRQLRDVSGHKAALERVFSPAMRFIRPLQSRAELEALLGEVARLNPSTVVEIGTASGGTLFMLTRAAADDAKLVSIDLPGGAFGGGYPVWRAPLYRSFARPGQHVHLLRRDSHDPSTLEALQDVLGGRRVDFLLIDGDHTYEGVKRDFEMYRALVRPGGMIGFHDIVPHSEESGCEVNRFWLEIRRSCDSVEFVENWQSRFGGIGLLRSYRPVTH
ncbi:MAG: class I SAM-dependent methyltransferase [Syntrophales bacterium]|jgi:predicted O-methyltransferase YrrM|nr:class I SAM-dependent methyltransferase [Syntrophales bacterium]MCU0555389.1 class I SAM-dependent methyltransferase [Syntrophales bacterium]MCU0582551.1 class I SAM-dependent methyltransferase [Syntrophales bacterium]